MNSINNTNQAIMLFDEQGTPTFRLDRETNSFLGISVTYDFSDENSIFEQCGQLFGLSKTKPLRNNRIGNTRVLDISNLLTELPIQIIISSVDLSNSELEQVITLYEKFGNVMRKRYRNVREYPLAHILHSRILDECIFNSIFDYSERNKNNTNFSIFIDNWAIPKNDVSIYLKERSSSFQAKINKLNREFNFPIQICVSSISLLNENNFRKRFIGVVASVISRSFLQPDNLKFSEYPFDTINNVETNKFFEITKKTIELCRKIMDDSSRNPPVLTF
jgi:hypothetical protein